MKAISVKQPWAYLLCAGIKGIENRTWRLPEKHKGKRVLIHASTKWDDRHRNMSHLFTNDQYRKELRDKVVYTKGAMILDGYDPEDSCIKFMNDLIKEL